MGVPRSVRERIAVFDVEQGLKYILSMSAVTLHAHLGGRQIALGEPYELPRNARSMVPVLPSSPEIESEDAWLRAATSSDAFEFLADPAENIYMKADGASFRNAI